MHNNGKNIKIILVIFALLYLLPLSVRPLISPDETRYAEISREMIHSGDWVVPHLNHLRYFEKPIMGYWMNSIAMLVFGENNFGVRLPTAVAVAITALMLYFLTKKQFGSSLGLFAAVGYLLTAIVFILGTVAVLDSMLTMALTGAAVLFYFAFHSTSMKRRLLFLALFGALIGCAFLIKGFLAFVVIGLTTGTYLIWEFSQDKFKRLKQRSVWTNIKWALLMLLVIILPLLIVVLPWSIMIYLREPDFWRFFVVEEHLQRFMAKNAQHKEPFFFYLPVILIGLLPWSLLLPMVISKWRSFKLDIPLIKYSLCWFVLPFIFFSTSKGKLPTYILPCIPPVIILLTFGFEQFFLMPNKTLKWLHGVAKFLIGIFTLAIITLMIFQITGIPGIKTVTGNSLMIFNHSTEWWKFVLIILALGWWIFALIKVLKIADSRKKIYYFMLGPALFFTVSLVAIPDLALKNKAPGSFLLAQQRLINAHTVIVSEYRIARAVCWFYKRDDVYLLFSANEFGYGINYSKQTKQRLLDKDEFSALVKKNMGNLVLIMTLKRYRKYLKRSLIPQPKHVISNDTCVFLEY